MSSGIGPRREQTVLDRQASDDLAERFDQLMGSLAEGALIFPEPFDLLTSAALARNGARRREAEVLFAATRAGMVPHYRVSVTEELAGSAETREVVNCVLTDRKVVAAMLMDLAEQLLEDEQEV